MLDVDGVNQNVIMTVIVIIAVICGYLIYTYKSKDITVKGQDKKVSFQADDNKIVMYGKDSCPWCKRQKTELGDKWSMVKYINCKDSPELCESNNITALPTWDIDGNRSEGFMKKSDFVKQCKI